MERPRTPAFLKEHFSGPTHETAAYLFTQSPTYILRNLYREQVRFEPIAKARHMGEV